MRLRSSLALGGALLLFAGCSFGSEGGEPVSTTSRESAAKEPSSLSAVLYTIGASTDPYGTNSAPGGFGVVTSLGDRTEAKIEVREPGLGSFGGAEWIDSSRILVPRGAPPLRRPLIYRFRSGRLEEVGASPLPRIHVKQAWSPDGALIASQPIVRCEPEQRTLYECYRQPGVVFVQRADGSGRRKVWDGHFSSWAPDGRLLVTDRVRQDRFEALDVETSERELALDPKRIAVEAGVRRIWGLGAPRWSADGRFLAASAGIIWPDRKRRLSTIVVAQSDGDVVRFLTSPYVISMFAWSPVGHRLAYTTSGFPDPHELFVLHEPTAKPVRLFVSGDRHFDWITWSPGGRRLLLDDETDGTWRRLSVEGTAGGRAVPRLGGRPIWCCPVNSYATNG